MRQLINFPTRDGTDLDLILTDSVEYCNSTISKSAPLALNDHCSVIVNEVRKQPHRYTTVSKRMTTPAAKSKVGLDLALADFSSVYRADTVDQKVNAFHEIINAICDKHCPKRNFRVREGDNIDHHGWSCHERKAIRYFCVSVYLTSTVTLYLTVAWS